MVASARIVLHEYKVTFLRWLVPLFFVLGCMIMALAVGLPVLLGPPFDLSLWISAGIAFFAGLAMPVGAVLMFLFIPQVTTSLDPQRRLLVMEYRRPIGRSLKEYPLTDIFDFRPLSIGERTHSLSMLLKSNKFVRLEYSATTDIGALEAQAAAIKAQLAPYLPPKSIRV